MKFKTGVKAKREKKKERNQQYQLFVQVFFFSLFHCWPGLCFFYAVSNILSGCLSVCVVMLTYVSLYNLWFRAVVHSVQCTRIVPLLSQWDCILWMVRQYFWSILYCGFKKKRLTNPAWDIILLLNSVSMYATFDFGFF